MAEPPATRNTKTWPQTMSRGRFLARAALVGAAFFVLHVILEHVMGGETDTTKRAAIAAFMGLLLAASNDYWNARLHERIAAERS